MSVPGTTPPGWYPDPWVAGGLRWWDGVRWTGQAAQPAGQVPPGSPWAPQDVGTLVRSEIEAARWARWGAWGQALWGVVAAIAFAVILREMWDLIQEVADTPPGAQVEEPVPTFPPGIYLFQLLSLVQLGGLVAWVVWQHRANTAAQALGLRLTRSPGWGVGGWFIPIVNFWFPYEAVRDNLPADHPGRPVLLHWWLGFLAQTLTLWIVAVAWVVNVGIGLACSLVQIAFACWWASRAERVLVLIGDEHRRRAGISA